MSVDIKKAISELTDQVDDLNRQIKDLQAIEFNQMNITDQVLKLTENFTSKNLTHDFGEMKYITCQRIYDDESVYIYKYQGRFFGILHYNSSYSDGVIQGTFKEYNAVPSIIYERRA